MIHARAEDIPRIEQGGDVYLNDTVDISGVTGWFVASDGSSFIQYCGGFDCTNYNNPFLLKLPLKTRVPGSATQYRFYIDPAIFSSRTGDWYQYDEDDKASHGNTIAFHVVAMYRNTTALLPNGSYVNQTEYLGRTTGMLTTQEIHYLPEFPVSDYLLARGDRLTIETRAPAKVWLFGLRSQIYDRFTAQNNITFNENETRSLEPGSYYVMSVYPGKNGEYDTRFSDDVIEYRDGWNGIQKKNIYGVQPLLVVNQLQEIINRTDDTFHLDKLEVQEPTITIEYFTEVPLYTNYSRYQEFKTETGLVSMFDVRGYTNAAPGTNITITLDKDKHVPNEMRKYTFYGEAKRNHYGNRSMYQIYVPIVWEKMTPYVMHTIEVTDALGAKTLHDFPISTLPADSYRPNATVKYAGERNPWIPTPTPAVVTVVQTTEIIRVVEKQVTPSDEQVRAQQEVVYWQGATEIAILIAAALGIIGCAILLFYGYYIHKKTMKELEWIRQK